MPSNPADRRQSPRLEAKLTARLDFSVLLREAESSDSGVQHLRAVAGHTVDLSAIGLAVVLHAQNIDEQYLTGDIGSMSIELDLPNGLSILRRFSTASIRVRHREPLVPTSCRSHFTISAVPLNISA